MRAILAAAGLLLFVASLQAADAPKFKRTAN